MPLGHQIFAYLSLSDAHSVFLKDVDAVWNFKLGLTNKPCVVVLGEEKAEKKGTVCCCFVVGFFFALNFYTVHKLCLPSLYIVLPLLTIINMHYVGTGTSLLFIIHQHQRVTVEVNTPQIIRGKHLCFMLWHRHSNAHTCAHTRKSADAISFTIQSRGPFPVAHVTMYQKKQRDFCMLVYLQIICTWMASNYFPRHTTSCFYSPFSAKRRMKWRMLILYLPSLCILITVLLM